MLVICCLGAAPSRSNTYVAGTVISPTNVTANEDTIYTYLQAGVDTYAPSPLAPRRLPQTPLRQPKSSMAPLRPPTSPLRSIQGIRCHQALSSL